MKRSTLQRRTPLKSEKPLKRSPWPIADRATQLKRGEARRRVKTRGDHIQELQSAFNEWIRLRDAGQPCISCGSYQGDWHAGHYRSVGSEPALRFEPDNVHKQCALCNTILCGSLAGYRINLIERIGLERVEWLEGAHPPQKLTIAEIRDMKTFYRAEVRRLKRGAA